VDYILVKDGMAEALPAILDSRAGLRIASRAKLQEAVRTLLTPASTLARFETLRPGTS
jgi:hypothetical protein